MTGVAAPNFAAQGPSLAAQTARNAEYEGNPFTDSQGTTYNTYLGMNNAGGSNPGIGINTGSVDPKLDDWSLLDQDEAARNPQQTATIGQVDDTIDVSVAGYYDGAADGYTPATVDVTVREPGSATTDPAGFVVADTAAIQGAVADTVTGVLNETGETIAIGDRLWGPIP